LRYEGWRAWQRFQGFTIHLIGCIIKLDSKIEQKRLEGEAPMINLDDIPSEEEVE